MILFPAIDLKVANYSYVDAAGQLPVRLGNSENIIAELMSAFSDPLGGSPFATKEAQVKGDIEKAQQALNKALATFPGMTAVNDTARSAKMILQRQFPDFDQEWARLKNKYDNLVRRALHNTRYPGINDRPVGKVSGRDVAYLNDGVFESQADLRDMIGSDTDVADVAAHFAAVEFVLMHDLSRSIAMKVGGLTGLNASQDEQVIDEHRTGAMVSLFLNTYMYGAQSACLLELIHVLKEKNLWDKTVIDVSGEFNRRPRQRKGGSDHGFHGASAAIYSGQVRQGPHIMGDIIADSGNATYGGTWGYGAPQAALGNTKLSVGHFASTMATLLGVPSPINAAPSLVERRPNGSIKPILPKGKIV